MTYAGIEAFLAICRHRNISKAAAELFISQSSLSIRLRTLEKELGCSLFFRHKGAHEIVLTEEGKRFYQLSLQYQEVVRKMQAVGTRKSSLRVSAINSVATYLLPPVYERFMKEHPDIHLEIQDMTIATACQKLMQGETDLAFTTEAPNSEQIRADIILKEPMVLICAADACYPSRIGLDTLPIEQEVYVKWNLEFVRWHQNTWGADAVPQIQLEIMSQLQMFVMKKDTWAIVPLSVANGLRVIGVRQLIPVFSLPDREVYALQRKTANANAAQIFLDITRQLWHMPKA